MIDFDDLMEDQEQVFTKDGVASVFEMLTQGSIKMVASNYGKGLVLTLILAAVAYTVQFIAGGSVRNVIKIN